MTLSLLDALEAFLGRRALCLLLGTLASEKYKCILHSLVPPPECCYPFYVVSVGDNKCSLCGWQVDITRLGKDEPEKCLSLLLLMSVPTLSNWG